MRLSIYSHSDIQTVVVAIAGPQLIAVTVQSRLDDI
jgi:hypothetical protein